jgi:hypothetical protein
VCGSEVLGKAGYDYGNMDERILPMLEVVMAVDDAVEWHQSAGTRARGARQLQLLQR